MGCDYTQIVHLKQLDSEMWTAMLIARRRKQMNPDMSGDHWTEIFVYLLHPLKPIDDYIYQLP
jgi:hypothetical protein